MKKRTKETQRQTHTHTKCFLQSTVKKKHFLYLSISSQTINMPIISKMLPGANLAHNKVLRPRVSFGGILQSTKGGTGIIGIYF